MAPSGTPETPDSAIAPSDDISPARGPGVEQAGDVCLDPGALDTLRAVQMPGGASLVDRAAKAFFDSVPGLLNDVRSGVHTGDTALAHRAVHTLKSSGAYLGLVKVSALSKALEEACAAGALADVKPQISQLEEALETGVRALEG